MSYDTHPESKPPSEQQPEEKPDLNFRIFDQLLSKYVSVWLWPILFAANTTISFSYINYRVDRGWGSLALLPLGLLGFGILASLQAWMSLLAYLRRFLIPRFLSASGGSTPSKNPETLAETDSGKSLEIEKSKNRDAGDVKTQQDFAGQILNRAVSGMLVALAMRFTVVLAELLLTIAGNR